MERRYLEGVERLHGLVRGSLGLQSEADVRACVLLAVCDADIRCGSAAVLETCLLSTQGDVYRASDVRDSGGLVPLETGSELALVDPSGDVRCSRFCGVRLQILDLSSVSDDDAVIDPLCDVQNRKKPRPGTLLKAARHSRITQLVSSRE